MAEPVPMIRFVPMTEEHVKAVAAIEKRTFSMPWSEESLMHEVTGTHGAHYLVGLIEDQVAAYGGFWQIFDEAHITNIAVDQPYRGRGYGHLLLEAMDELCRSLGILYQTLEVRVSNEAAIHLYEVHGFASAGIRPGYYEAPKEAANIMWKTMES